MSEESNSGDGDGQPVRIPRLSRRRLLQTTGTLAALSGLGSTAVASEHDTDDHHVADLVPTSDATHSATTSGPWTDSATWDNGVPNDGARVHVPSGVTVTVDANPSARLHWVRVDGTLRAATSQTAELQVDTLITTQDSAIQIGTESDPVGPSSELTITFIDRGPIDESWDPERKTRGLVAAGTVEVHGAAKTPHATLAHHPTVGDSALELDATPTNWRAGDALVVPGVSPRENHDEEVTVASVSGSTVQLEETLQYDHVPPAGDLDSYALNLERHVRLRSESTEMKRRGHVMIMSPGSTIRYAGLYELGRTDKSIPFSNPAYKESEIRNDGVFDLGVNDNRRARYALHYHKTGPRTDVEPHDATGCVVAPRTRGNGWKGSPGWGFVNHQSYAHVHDCVSYKVFGSHFQTETGVELGSFVNNFALRSEGSGDDPDFREVVAWADHANRPLIDDYGHNGIGFWLHGPLVLNRDNVAAGQRNHGFAYWNRAIGDYVPDEVDDPAVPPSELEREIEESDIGRHRGTIPNVPAPYADDRPSEQYNVAPGSAGPNVAEFAHATDAADDGTVFVDEGSIPIRDIGNTAFACGSGMEVMNHMRGAGSQMDRQTDYYGLIKDYTAWNIGRRDGESDLPDTQIYQNGDLSFEFPRGTGIGLAMRYASHLKVVNPRLIGVGEGVGITHNMRAEGMVIEDATIENWSSGIGALTDGLMEIRNPTFSNIQNYEINIQGEQILAGNPTTKMWDVDDGYEIYMNPSNDVTTDWDREYWLDDRRVYFEDAAPSDAETDPRLVGGRIEPGSSDTAAVETAINVGGSSYTAGDGTEFQADTGYSGGTTASTGDPIAGTDDDALYQSERYGDFSYDISVADGTYDVVLHFAETYWTADGDRVFDVSVNGDETITNLDVHGAVGHDSALVRTISGVDASDGTLTVSFNTDVDNAVLNGIEVVNA
ncbi:malectin domain-containing carbohydrate-binding protein [Natronorubrum halophilum]|uniref:malectin domain-containing carbohydrate-binding protein n=1 Tax=Natronorubrum halophilum TaxID=1702106 RepID=UPI00148568ED|nr:malectin domain-containing carbohydrate-binding protein [Natronorubrum halophilum]